MNIRASVGFLLIFVVALFTPITQVQAKDNDNKLVGIYRMEGGNPDGSKYSGAVEIKSDGTAVLSMSWAFDGTDGQPLAHGVGFVHNKELVVYLSTFSGAPGLAGYTIKGKKLEGRWVAPGVDVPQIENLVKSDAKSLGDAVKKGDISPVPHEHVHNEVAVNWN